MGILRTLLWILLGYYLLKLLSRLMQPWLRSYAHKKSEELFRQAYGGSNRQAPESDSPGSITVDKKPPSKSTSQNSIGEYIEFEEIE